MKRVLILDANQRSALAVTRSLGKQGVPLLTGDDSATALAGNSCYSLHYIHYPSPRHQPEQFISTIANVCHKDNIDIIFPMTELTTTLLLKHRGRIAEVLLPLSDTDSIDTLADKCSLMKLAASLDIPIPKTQYFESAENMPEKLTDLEYPLVMKPAKSWLKYKDEWLHTSVKIAHNPAQVTEIIQSDAAFHSAAFMLQAFVPGKGEGVFALYNEGKPLTFFAHKRLREKPPQGGVSVLSESATVDKKLESYSRKLLEHVNWHGVAMVEFRVDDHGNASLMEINTRFWGSLQLAIDAGVDFPWLLYQTTCGISTTPVSKYKTGTRLRWLLGNVDWLYLILRDNHFSAKEKVCAVLSFATPSLSKTRLEVFRLHDPKPFWWELKNYLRNLRN